MSFAKPAKTLPEQVALLRARGLVIEDEASVGERLKHYNYYRLSAYTRPFLATIDPPQFKSGVRFQDVWQLYCFDRELRHLVHEAAKGVEISTRSRWAYEFGHARGALAYADSSNFAAGPQYVEALRNLDEQIDRSHEEFIRHFKTKYGMARPPIWAACEVMSFGVLSRMFALLRDARIKRRIAETYSLPEPVLESLLHHLTYVRNICAHHSRLWNRRFTITLALPVSYPVNLVQSVNRNSPANRKLYNTLVALTYMCGVIDSSNEWRTRLLDLINRHPPEWCDKMGFPTDWPKRPIWSA